MKDPSPAKRELVMPYEATSQQAMARGYPDDPLSGEEICLYLDALTGDIDFQVGLRLQELAAGFADTHEAEAILSCGQPTVLRFEVLDRVLQRYVDTLLGST